MLGSPTTTAGYVHEVLNSAARFDGTLSVLTYNVKGLPWPLASGRSAALQKIALRLRALRDDGRQPEVVLLQEAFTDDARAIANAAGYRYVADGPAAGDRSTDTASPDDLKFAEAGSWLKGEDMGKMVGSGIQILSDFPIVAVHSSPFAPFACAGFDCLSNKGMMLAVIDVPQLDTRVQIGNIHMNSKRHSMVGEDRQLFAYQRQVDSAHTFFDQHYDARYPLIFGGDFNIGKKAKRAEYLFAVSWPVQPRNDGLRRLAAQTALVADAQEAAQKSEDWQFSASGSRARVTPVAVNVPFGNLRSDDALSDHIGYTIDYRIEAD